MVTMSSADKALKTLYLGVLTDQLNTEINPFLSMIKRTSQDVWGKEVRKVARYGISMGIGAGTEDGNLPSAGQNKYEQMVSTLKNLYGTIELSDKAIRASSNEAGAFVNLLDSEMDGLIKASQYNLGRMLFGDGTGILCDVTDVDPLDGTLLTVDNVKNLIEGLTVEFYDATDNTPITSIGARQILSIDRANKKIVISGIGIVSAVCPDGTHLVVKDSYNNEITGLGAIFKSTGNLYGLSRSTHKWLIPYMKSSVGSISETAIQAAIDYVEENAGSKVNYIVCSAGVKRAFIKHLNTYRRNIEFNTYNGGRKEVSYNGIPVVSDRFCPAGTMYLLNTDDFALHQLCDWSWLEGEDGKILKQVAGKPVYTATLVKYAELFCARPCGQAMLTGITEEN